MSRIRRQDWWHCMRIQASPMQSDRRVEALLWKDTMQKALSAGEA